MIIIEHPIESTKIMIKADSIQRVIEIAKVKFGLPEEKNYKVFLSEDGICIEDDDILNEFSRDFYEQTKKPLSLLILPTDITFNQHQEEKKAKVSNETNSLPMGRTLNPNPNLEVTATTSGSSHNTVIHEDNLCQEVDTSILEDVIMSKASPRLIEACNGNKRADPKDRRRLVAEIAEYMINELHDTSRKTCSRFAEILCVKYPQSFADTVNGILYGTGIDSLRTSIHNAVLYRKKATSQTKKATLNAMVDSDEEESQKRRHEQNLKTKGDQYGCVEYQPSLPVNETVETQESKRMQLHCMFSLLERDQDLAMQLMKDTYPTQRLVINVPDRDLGVVTSSWPFLKEELYFLEHANVLLGKDVSQTWQCSIGKQGKALRQYFKTQKVQSDIKEKKIKILKDCKDWCTMTRSEGPKTLVIFPLLLIHFSEMEDHLFKILEVGISDVDIFRHTSMNPILLIRGNSLYDPQATATVVVEKETISCQNPLQGFLITFLCYYVFGYKYPPEIAKTLEFIQRQFLKINPPKGQKGGKRHKNSPYDTAVFKLARKVADFASDFVF